MNDPTMVRITRAPRDKSPLPSPTLLFSIFFSLSVLQTALSGFLLEKPAAVIFMSLFSAISLGIVALYVVIGPKWTERSWKARARRAERALCALLDDALVFHHTGKIDAAALYHFRLTPTALEIHRHRGNVRQIATHRNARLHQEIHDILVKHLGRLGARHYRRQNPVLKFHGAFTPLTAHERMERTSRFRHLLEPVPGSTTGL